MRYFRLLAPPILCLAVSLTLAFGLCACATPTVIAPVAVDCAARIPPQLADPVPGADLPAGQSAGEWVAFGDAQTGRLDQANDEKATVIWIQRQCAAEQAKAAEALKPRPWWRWW